MRPLAAHPSSPARRRTHTLAAAVQAGLERAFPIDPPQFLPTVPHGYAYPGVVGAGLSAAGFTVEEEQELTPACPLASVADVATGYLTGTPVRATIVERGDGPTVRATVIEEMTNRLVPGTAVRPQDGIRLPQHGLNARRIRRMPETHHNVFQDQRPHGTINSVLSDF
ncbi:hypothetical protein V1460_18310 [Streptomyces sp. SCSIO 30461]|uniref:hypothetical protein n=1 Tax=Streptomyces sp. SCSIO 30461 TaxID=3118085 RepID=UPI0030CFFB64